MHALTEAGNGSALPDDGAYQPAPSPFSELAPSPSKLTPLVSVAEEAEIADMGKHGSGAVGAADATTTAALQLMRSTSGLSLRRAASGSTPPPAKKSLREQLRGLRQRAAYVWWGLPTACKATLLMAGEQGLRARAAAASGMGTGILGGSREERRMASSSACTVQPCPACPPARFRETR